MSHLRHGSRRAVSGLSAPASHRGSIFPLRHSTQNQPEAPGPTAAAGGALAADQAGLAADQAGLAERIRNGDAPAWRELIDRHEPLLRRIARQYRLSSQDTDDVVQFTWLRCLEHIDAQHRDRPAGLGRSAGGRPGARAGSWRRIAAWRSPSADDGSRPSSSVSAARNSR
jgi:sigma-70-like protein